jgi:GAF domain-containing protein
MSLIDLPTNYGSDLKNKLNNIIGNEKNFIANASNFASLIFHQLDGVTWAGFYFLANEHLILGPYVGKVACVRISITEGVCGSAARNRKPVIVPDVHKFPGYIPCDPSANSELVVPLFFNNSVIGVFDIDSSMYGRFTEFEANLISDLLAILVKKSLIKPILDYYGAAF